jgi:hypothetical protein
MQFPFCFFFSAKYLEKKKEAGQIRFPFSFIRFMQREMMLEFPV